MNCPQCRTQNSSQARSCTLCGEVLVSPSAKRPLPTLRGSNAVSARDTAFQNDNEYNQDTSAWAYRPLPALGIGLLLMPLVKAIWIPNYMFNFLATLVHEIGHSLTAWILGRPSYPAVSLFGGGATPVFSQVVLLNLIILGAMGWYGWQMRDDRRWIIATAIGMMLYCALAFTGAAPNLVTAGGVLFEIGGAAACFYWVLTAKMKVGLERPLYALWGWWMLINRTTETWLMMRDPSYWDDKIIAKSGLAEGFVNDLPKLSERMDLAPNTLLLIVLCICLSALPIAFGLSWLKHRHDENQFNSI